MKKIFSSLILSAFLTIHLALPIVAQAAVTEFSPSPTATSNTAKTTTAREITLLAPITGTWKTCYVDTKTKETVCKTDFITYLKGLFKVVITFSSILAVIMITIGGFEYMLSATELGKTNGMDRIKNSLIGLGIALASFLILYTINPELTRLDIIKSAQQGPSSTSVTDPKRIQQIQADNAALLRQIEAAKIANPTTNPTNTTPKFTYGDIEGVSSANSNKINVAKREVSGILTVGEQKVVTLTQEGVTALEINRARTALAATILDAQAKSREIDTLVTAQNSEGVTDGDPAALEKAKIAAKVEMSAVIAAKAVELEKKISYREACPKDYIVTVTPGSRRNKNPPPPVITPCVAPTNTTTTP